MPFSPVFVVNPQKKIEKISPIDNLTLTSTNAQVFTVDISKYRKIWIIAKSTHDADIDIRFRLLENVNHKAFNGSDWEIQDTVILPKSDSSVFHINTALPYLTEVISTNLNIRVAAKTVPTSGALTITIFGEVK